MSFGVDEAGKGPVLGSMFAAAVVADPEQLPSEIGDSKTLTPAKRESLAGELKADSDVSIGLGEVRVAEIDDPETDMNELTVTAQARALDDTGLTEGNGYVDAGDVDADRFGRRVERAARGDLTIHAEHGADEKYPLVGAASVVAKVARDAHVATLDENYDRPIGSGYPGDDRTRAFLEAYVADTGELPACARRSWQTCTDVLETAAQKTFEEF